MTKKLDNLQILKQLYLNNPGNPDHAKNYAEAIHDCLFDGLIGVEEAKREYEGIQNQFPRLYRIKNYIAETLSPWEHQDVNEIIEAVKSLDEYYHLNPEQESIAESFAISLWLLYCHPKATDRDSIINSLSELLNAFPENDTINDKYYDILDFDEHSYETHNSLTDIELGIPTSNDTNRTPMFVEEAIANAQQLQDLSEQQTYYPDLVFTSECIATLAKEYPKNLQINECYIVSLYNCLPFTDHLEEVERLLKSMIDAYHVLPSEKVAEIVAQAIEEQPPLMEEYLHVLEDLLSVYPDNKSILDSYGYVLSILANDESVSFEVQHSSKEKLLQLYLSHKENTSIEDYYLDSCHH